MKPIDADAFKKILQNEYIRDDADGNSNYLVECIIERLDNMPNLGQTKDRRVFHSEYNRYYMCSICNHEIKVPYDNVYKNANILIVCPYCKTKMGSIV